MNTETSRCFPFDCAPEAISVAPGCDPIIMPRRTPGREASGAPKIFGKIEILLLEYLFGLCCALFPTIEKYLVMFAWGWVRRLTTTKIMAIEVEILGCKCWDYSGGICPIILVMSYLKIAHGMRRLNSLEKLVCLISSSQN